MTFKSFSGNTVTHASQICRGVRYETLPYFQDYYKLINQIPIGKVVGVPFLQIISNNYISNRISDRVP